MQAMRAPMRVLRGLREHRTLRPSTSIRSPLSPRAHLSTSRPSFANPRPTPNFSKTSKPSLNFGATVKEQIRLAKKDYPVLLPVLVVLTVASVSGLGLLLYDDYYNVHPQYAAYPPPVELGLRQALYHVHVRPDPVQAEQHFLEALEAAEEHKMELYSPEVMGIRTRLAEMLEKFGRAQRAVEVLQATVKLCENKVADIDRGASEELPEQAKLLRSGMLKTIVRSRVKIANLYEGDYLQDPTSAKQALSDAVGLLVKETKDPQTNGFSQDNATGLPLEEIASMLSQMGDLYATTGEEANAVQVYMLTLQPLRAACNGTRSCKEVQVLSNIASTMDLAMKKPGATINGRPADPKSLAAARRATLKWADQAIATAEVVKPEDRDEICELGLISAEMTKADLLLEDGKSIQAREAFRSIIPRLKEKGLDTLVKTAEQGIQRAGV